ncbi:MAG: HepT-like ribonuclease domain-containing protein [Polaromonas sp.]
MPWRTIIATRNQLIHGYVGIDDDVMWSIVQTDIPVLLEQLRAIKKNDFK